jgi:hypothetical protein
MGYPPMWAPTFVFWHYLVDNAVKNKTLSEPKPKLQAQISLARYQQ